MAQLSTPSEALPGPPRLSLDLPDDWTAFAPGLAMLRARAPQRPGVQTPEVRVDLWTEDAETTVRDLLSQIAAQFAPHAQSEPPFEVELGSRTWTGVNLGWADGGSPQIEVQLATALSGSGPFTRFVTVIGRIGGPGAEDDYDLLQSIMETVRVEGDEEHA